MKALIIINGTLPNSALVEPLLQTCDLIICADGGANQAIKRGIMPDFIVGDFDSINSKTIGHFADTSFIHLPDQNATDFEKTLQIALEKGVDSATVLGISGARFDHQLCNLNVMEKYNPKIELNFVDDWGTGFFITSRLEFEGEIGQQISLHAMRRVEGIVTSGLKYPLQNEALEWAVRDGQSNEIVANPVGISLTSGCLFVFISHNNQAWGL